MFEFQEVQRKNLKRNLVYSNRERAFGRDFRTSHENKSRKGETYKMRVVEGIEKKRFLLFLRIQKSFLL